MTICYNHVFHLELLNSTIQQTNVFLFRRLQWPGKDGAAGSGTSATTDSWLNWSSPHDRGRGPPLPPALRPSGAATPIDRCCWSSRDRRSTKDSVQLWSIDRPCVSVDGTYWWAGWGAQHVGVPVTVRTATWTQVDHRICGLNLRLFVYWNTVTRIENNRSLLLFILQLLIHIYTILISGLHINGPTVETQQVARVIFMFALIDLVGFFNVKVEFLWRAST